MTACRQHVQRNGSVSWACVLPEGHPGGGVFTEPDARIVETITVLAADRTMRSIYLWSDGFVTWKPNRYLS